MKFINDWNQSGAVTGSSVGMCHLINLVGFQHAGVYFDEAAFVKSMKNAASTYNKSGAIYNLQTADVVLCGMNQAQTGMKQWMLNLGFTPWHSRAWYTGKDALEAVHVKKGTKVPKDAEVKSMTYFIVSSAELYDKLFPKKAPE